MNYWYRVEMLSGHDTYLYFGSSKLDEQGVMEHLAGGEFVLLEDLVFFDENDHIQGWSEWDPHYLARVFLNPKYVISVMPMVEDLRKETRGSSNLLQLPKAIRSERSDADE